MLSAAAAEGTDIPRYIARHNLAAAAAEGMSTGFASLAVSHTHSVDIPAGTASPSMRIRLAARPIEAVEVVVRLPGQDLDRCQRAEGHWRGSAGRSWTATVCSCQLSSFLQASGYRSPGRERTVRILVARYRDSTLTDSGVWSLCRRCKSPAS